MHQYLEPTVLFILALSAIAFFGRLWLDKLAYEEVHGKPKMPMAMCDKHGLIPKDAMLQTTAVAVGRPDLDVEHCPICMGERTAKVKEMLGQ